MPRRGSSIAEITADSHTSKNCLSNLCCEVCVSFVVIIHIEIICADVISVATDPSISITITISSAAIVYIDNLLANNSLRISLIAIWALADASIVQKDERTLAL